MTPITRIGKEVVRLEDVCLEAPGWFRDGTLDDNIMEVQAFVMIVTNSKDRLAVIDRDQQQEMREHAHNHLYGSDSAAKRRALIPWDGDKAA